MFFEVSGVAFIDNVSLKCSGIISWSLPPSLLPDDLSIDKRDSNNFFSPAWLAIASRT